MNAAERLERTQWDTFWRPADAEVVDRPGLLLLRCPRPVRYLNAVLRTRAPEAALPALVAEATALLAHAHARWHVPDTIPRARLERELDVAGWTPGHRHEARCIAPSEHVPRESRGISVHAIDTIPRLRDAIAVSESAFGLSRHTTDEELAQQLRECTVGRVHRFVAYDEQGPVASGGLTAFADLRVGFLWAGGTVARARARGAYSAVLAARIRRAAELGLDLVGLYAQEDSSAPIVAAQGFAKVGDMTFWERRP